MLYLEHADGYADMTALMCLVTIKMTNHVLFAVDDRYLLAFSQSDALVAFLPGG